MAKSVEAGSGQSGRNLRTVAIAALFAVVGAAAASACAEGGSVTSSGSASTSSSGMGGAGGEGVGGQGGTASSSSSSSTTSSSSSSTGGGMGGSGGMACVPTTEVCDGVDNDCNDKVDDVAGEPCQCVTGQKQDCYTGPSGTQGVGICVGGSQTCDANGQWGPCEGQVLPEAAEACDGKDNTCDMNVDEGCTCTTGMTQGCYTGPMGTENKGLCKPGMQTCDATGMWGTCTGDTTPVPEVCNGLDDDCDGTIDNGNPGGGAQCDAAGLGECKKGTLNCINGAVKCSPAMPTPELCDGLDNNCDGNVDEGNPGGGTQCMTGLLGLCATGLTQCTGVGGVMCKPNVTPGQLNEACNSLDDDCDGLVDDAIPQVGMACTKPGQLGVCQFGTYECPVGAAQLTCNTPLPGTVQETCNGKDDDCNGTIDDPALVNGLPCTTAFPGVCSAGLTQCVGGSLSCNATVSPGSQNEICDSKDNNCNGQTDEMNPTPACTAQNPMAQFVTTWGCTMGSCQISQCQVGYADINGAPGDGCECATDQYATQCTNASSLSVTKGSTVNMIGKVESPNGSDWITFNFTAPGVLGQSYQPKITLANSAGGQYAMDVFSDCNNVAQCNGAGGAMETGVNINVWEASYQYNQGGNPQGPWSDMDVKPISMKVRVYRVGATPPTCDQYVVTATNP